MDENDSDERGLEPQHSAAAGPRGRTRRRLLWAGAVGAVAVIAIGAAVFAGGGGPQQPAATTPSPSATAAPGADPGAAPVEGSEVLAPEEDGGPGASDPDESAPAPEATPFAEGTLPPTATAEGELVDGYPEPIMTPMSASDVLNSAIATEGAVTQVTLVARTGASREEIRDHYRTLWRDSGLESEGQDADPAFTGGSTSLTLGFAPDSGTGTVYVLFGVFGSR